MEKKSAQKGQALIIILLVSAVGLTLGLSLASRAVRDTGAATDIEESARAFSAAEAGLQESAQNIGNLSFSKSGVSVGGAEYDVEINPVGGGTNPYRFPGRLKDNQPISIWLVEHNSDGTINYSDSYKGDSIRVCWGGGDSDEAALEASLYYIGGGEYRLAREVYNPSSAIVNGGAAGGRAPGGAGCGSKFDYMQDILFGSMRSAAPYSSGDTLLMLKIRPITRPSGGGTRLAVDPLGNVLKSQGEEHVSIGAAAGGQTTKIRQFISHPVPPEIFDVVVYSNSAINK